MCRARSSGMGLGLPGLGLAQDMSRALVEGLGQARARLGLKPGHRDPQSAGHVGDPRPSYPLGCKCGLLQDRAVLSSNIVGRNSF